MTNPQTEAFDDRDLHAPHRFDADRDRLRRAVLEVFRGPFRLSTWTTIVYHALAFPLGLFYFVFLVVGLPLSTGLLIVWIGFPLLVLVLAGGWAFAAFERETANHLLGARVPPMHAPPTAGRSLLERIADHLSNRVTWTSFAFLLLKLPMGVISFAALVIGLAVPTVFVAAPFLYRDEGYGVHFDGALATWWIDSLGEAILVSLFGLVLLLVFLQIFRGLGYLWARLAAVLLGAEEHRTAGADGANGASGPGRSDERRRPSVEVLPPEGAPA